MAITLDGSNGITLPDNIVHEGDTNTAIRFPAADTVTIETAGSERVRVDSSGNVGIGTTSPTADLSVGSITSSSGDVHLRTSKTAFELTPSNTDAGGMDINVGFVAGGQGPLKFSIGSTERARIDSSGNLLVGTTTAYGRFAVESTGLTNIASNFPSGSSGTAYYGNVYSTAQYFARWEYRGSAVGSITTNGGSTAYNTSSDYRLKENVAPMQNALDTVAQLNPVTYTWKADGSAGQGFIAHELQAVVPDCVTGEKDAVDADGNPQYQGVDTSFLVATLVAAIKEQQATIAALTARIETLEARP